MKQNNSIKIQENEMDLSGLYKTIVKGKWFITIFTTLLTLGAIIYIQFKHITPIYSGSIMIEIGEVKNIGSNPVDFDNSNTLKFILEKLYDVTVSIQRGTNRILIISALNKDKKQIIKNIEDAVGFTIKRHKEKAKLFDSSIMTKQVGYFEIGDKPINTLKKKQIVVVSFITGLILSIFLVLFVEFIRNEK